MKSGFEQNLIEALEAVTYSTPEDNARFLAAVQDLSVNSPDEGKLFLRNADDRFIQICHTAMSSKSNNINTIINQASKYLQEEYFINEGQADFMARTATKAFAVYGGAELTEEDFPEEPKDEGENEQAPRKTKLFLVAAGIIVALLVCVLIIAFGKTATSNDSESTEQTTAEQTEAAINPEIKYDDKALVEGADVLFSVDGASDNNAVEWESDNPDVLVFSTVDTGKASAKKAGITNITAKFDGQALEKKIGVHLAEKNKFKVDKTEITVNGGKDIVVSYSGDSDYTYSTVENSDLLEAEWTEDWYGDSTYLKLKALGEGTTTLTLWVGDEDRNEDDSVESLVLTVHCHTE